MKLRVVTPLSPREVERAHARSSPGARVSLGPSSMIVLYGVRRVDAVRFGVATWRALGGAAPMAVLARSELEDAERSALDGARADVTIAGHDEVLGLLDRSLGAPAPTGPRVLVGNDWPVRYDAALVVLVASGAPPASWVPSARAVRDRAQLVLHDPRDGVAAGLAAVLASAAASSGGAAPAPAA